MNTVAERQFQRRNEAIGRMIAELGEPGMPADESTCDMRFSVEAVPHASIAQRAYLRAERRGFEPGHEREDWLAAEAELAGLWFAAESDSKPGARS